MLMEKLIRCRFSLRLPSHNSGKNAELLGKQDRKLVHVQAISNFSLRIFLPTCFFAISIGTSKTKPLDSKNVPRGLRGKL